MVTTWMIYGLIAYMVGVVVARFISAEVGDVVRIIGAVVFVIAWLVSFVK